MKIRVLKVLVFVAALIPGGMLIARGFTGDLTANPIEYITDQTGSWALAFLMISLSVTPVRRLTGWSQVIRFRRMLGLFSFFYASLHMLTWLVLDQSLTVLALSTTGTISGGALLMSVAADVVKRPFITMGMTTYLLLLPLAITSNMAMIRRLGRRWQYLHRAVYIAGITAVTHFWWLVKADVTEPQRWAILLVVLLGFRAWWTYRTSLSSRS